MHFFCTLFFPTIQLIEDLHSGGILHVMGDDFRNLVAWAHSHATICQHMPYQGGGYTAEEPNTYVLPWYCTAGHAYNWPLSSLSDRVGEAKEILSRAKRRKRVHCKEEEGEQEAEEGPTDLSVTREEGPAESDDSLVTHLSGEQREAPTAEQAKRKRQKKKKKAQDTSTSEPQEEAPFPSSTAGKSNSSWDASLPKMSQVFDSPTLEMDRIAEDKGATAAALDDSQPSMHLEDLCSGMDTDSAGEDEPMTTSQSGAGDAVATTASWSQGQRLQAEGRPSSPEPRRPPNAGPTTSAASTEDRNSRSKAAVKKKPKGLLGGLCNVLSFQAWLRSTRPIEGRSLGCLALSELDALLMSYLKYMWDGGSRQLTHVTLVCHTRCLDRFLRAQGCFYSVLRSPELPQTRKLLDQYCKQLHERETERYAATICSVTESEEEELRRLGVLGRSSPEALLHLVLFNNLRAFGPAHLYRTWPVPAGKFRPLRLAPVSPRGSGVACVVPVPDCLEWTDPGDPSQTPLRMLAKPDVPPRCPLRDFCAYATKHTAGLISDHDALYSSVRAGVHLHSHEWYSRTPLSRARMDKMLKALAQRVEAIRITRMVAPV
ncbi:hypothetical protein ACEWY4_014841 [Coilia grayii]|uniref:Uncharacterized protein n=1 Tax=Coilia grayii TaxID=363190 RepID=A0ABD1JTT6_9TELE